jgi:hypothetical protein
MAQRLQKLPTGIQTFSEIIEENYLYVDKTPMLINLIENGKAYFYARPRRFGKSLTLTTLEALFQGRKELFKGLYAEQWLNRPEFRPRPVIRLSMNEVTTDSGIDALKESMCYRVRDVADTFEVALVDSSLPADLFGDLIKKTARLFQEKVVILIDEYDKPYIDFIDDPEMANKVRETLANFYVRVKANDEHTHFVMLTGISKFAKMGVFSKLNNLTDSSLRDDYAAMCGITRVELLEYFSAHLEATAEKMKITKDELVDKMEDFYDGFSFNGKVKLYNPYSTLRFFEDRSFSNYWFDSGTSTMMAKYLKTKELTIEQFRNLPVSDDFVRNPGELDSAPPEGFLYQNGFLTLREGAISDFSLDYPNKEVLNTMSRLLSQKFLQTRYDDLTTLVMIHLDKVNIRGLIKDLNMLLASIPYDDYSKALEQKVEIQGFTFPVQEWLYRSSVLAFMRGCGLVVQAEMHTNRGRADLVLKHKEQIWIIELKVAYKGESAVAKAEEAYNQILEKNYDKPYLNPICAGLAIDDEKREITEYKSN